MRWLQVVIFLLVLIAVTASLHGFLWWQFVRAPGWNTAATHWATVVTWLLAGSIPLSLLLLRVLPRPAAEALGWVAFTWMGLAFFLLAFAVVGSSAKTLATLIDPSRREFFSRIAAIGAGLGAVMTSGVALRTALDRVAIKTVRVSLSKLPEAFDGMTVVQLSDIHVGPTIGKTFIEGLVAKCNALDPDVVVITGDLVDGSVAALGELVSPLRNLRAREGVYFVTGNHEYYSGADEWLEFLTTLGVRPLRNERVSITREGSAIDLAGVDDWSTRRLQILGHGTDLGAALRDRELSRVVVLLAHQPKAVAEAAQKGVDLVLSGHTHGGQIWPWNYLVKLDQPYLSGLHREGPTQVYVSEGTGYWGPPMRLGTHGEITRVVLCREQA